MARTTTDVAGGRFDFDDGGTYCGGWEDGKAHGHGVCTGPKSQGEYSGSWHFGFEVSGVYTWPSGSTYEGQWQNGKRHGLGVESRGRWTYRGEWTQGFKGRYGIRQSVSSGAKYEGTWANGLQDGYGSETYADGGTFQGQWMRGMRHGYGVRTSANFGLASHFRPKSSARGSLSSIPASEQADPASDRDRKIDDFRGGFVLKSRSDEPPTRRRSLVEKSSSFKKSILQGLKIKKQRSTGDIDRRGVSSMRSSGSNLSSASSESGHSATTHGTGGSIHTDSNVSFVSQDELCDAAVTETYMGEWKNDRRCGYGVAERSDGLKYQGEWYNNKKYGYGVTILKDGTKEEGKYKNNVLVSSGKKKHLFVLRSAKFKERIEAAVQAAQRGAQIALQKADIAISRTATGRGKAEQADIGAMHAREDSDIARMIAKQFDPDLKLPVSDVLKNRMYPDSRRPPAINTSNQSVLPHSPASIKIEMSTDTSKQNMSIRGVDIQPNSPSIQDRYSQQQQQPQQQSQRAEISRDRYDPATQANFSPKPQYQQDRYSNQPMATHQQYQNQPMTSLNQDGYANAQPLVTVQQDVRYPATQPVITLQQNRYPNPPSTPAQARYVQQSQGYPQSVNLQQSQGYPQSVNLQQQQQQYVPQNVTPNYLDPSGRSPVLQDQPPIPNRQGSFRRSTRDPGGYAIQQVMSDHFDHYRQEPRSRVVIKHGRRIPSPPRGGGSRELPTGGMYPVQHYHPTPRSSYGPDATPDSGVSESMDAEDLSPSRFARKANLPPMIYADSHASSLLSFAPSEEESRTVSPTMSSIGLDSEMGSEISTGSNVFQRTASLYVNPPSRKKISGPPPEAADSVFKRKKSLQHGPIGAGVKAKVIPREEVAILSSQRREEVRRMQYESERLRANPFLYLVRPDLKDWFSRQQLIMLVLFINISLAILFFKLLS